MAGPLLIVLAILAALSTPFLVLGVCLGADRFQTWLWQREQRKTQPADRISDRLDQDLVNARFDRITKNLTSEDTP